MCAFLLSQFHYCVCKANAYLLLVLVIGRGTDADKSADKSAKDGRNLGNYLAIAPSENLVDTWLSYVKNKRTVVFCASVKHAEQIAKLFQDAGIDALAVSGNMKTSERNEQLAKFASGDIKVLCACDLLNEGWDCPQTEAHGRRLAL